ncbi:cell envelope integrity protein CreD [Sphingomonas sp. RB1R13]|uniref:cell envelope integrity protein CreD n=1 Tax=Sphingomonas sp. RB1R13 TaxID=3096159 RepID=UPI002FCB5CDB
MRGSDQVELTPGKKFVRALLVGFLLAIPIFAVWLMIGDRQSQSARARQSIAAGWGGPQTIAGPELSIPFKQTVNTTEQVNGTAVTHTTTIDRRLILAPSGIDAATVLLPERRSRSIYDVVIYRAQTRGRALFQLPSDLASLGVQPGTLEPARAEIRFGVSDARGLSANPDIRVGGTKLPLGPGGGTSLVGSGFYAPIDLTKVDPARLAVDFNFTLRGNGSIAMAPRAGDTAWKISSPWSNPSFAGGFLPDDRTVTPKGFEARYRIGNLALGRSLLFVEGTEAPASKEAPAADAADDAQVASIALMEPVDLYSQVDRATKYGFLFVGFTFLAYLLFDVIGGVRVATVEYLLAGAGLVLFFVLLLAFAEVIGFTPAYILAALAITGLNTAYSAAVLKSWRRAGVIGAILAALYAVLYVLLSLEAYSLLIGALLLFAALAGTMYVTRRLDWAGVRGGEVAEG